MDPVRGVIHLGLKLTETTLDRALDVVRLVDTLLVSTAVPPVRERDDESPWPAEEQADLDALSATLRARAVPTGEEAERVTSGVPATAGARSTRSTSASKKAAPAKRAPRKSPAKKTTAKTQQKVAAKTPSSDAQPATKAATKAATKRAPAKKTTGTTTKKAAPQKAATKKASATGARRATAKKAAPTAPAKPTVLPGA